MARQWPLEPPWDVREVEGRGKAAFCRHKYSEGDEIWAEAPLVWVPFHWPFSGEQVEEVDKRVAALDTEKKKRFFSAANVYGDDAPSEASGIFYTNSFDMCDAHHGTSCAMYCSLARLNHSCAPNTRQEYDKETLYMRLFATRDIQPGDQLFDSYIDIEEPVATRRKELLDIYRFHCDCRKCELDADGAT